MIALINDAAGETIYVRRSDDRSRLDAGCDESGVKAERRILRPMHHCYRMTSMAEEVRAAVDSDAQQRVAIQPPIALADHHGVERAMGSHLHFARVRGA